MRSQLEASGHQVDQMLRNAGGRGVSTAACTSPPSLALMSMGSRGES
jgi:hypothetical protein